LWAWRGDGARARGSAARRAVGAACASGAGAGAGARAAARGHAAAAHRLEEHLWHLEAVDANLNLLAVRQLACDGACACACAARGRPECVLSGGSSVATVEQGWTQKDTLRAHTCQAHAPHPPSQRAGTQQRPAVRGAQPSLVLCGRTSYVMDGTFMFSASMKWRSLTLLTLSLMSATMSSTWCSRKLAVRSEVSTASTLDTVVGVRRV
jgi:hypothetical protein